MQPTTSFAPLAGRLAAQAAALRPVDGARDNLAKFMALVMCALLDMLILMCEMLDARAAIDVRPVVAPASRVSNAAFAPAPSVGRHAFLGLAPKVRAVAPRPAHVPSETAEAIPSRPWLAWSRDAGPLRAAPAATRWPPPENAVFPADPTHAQFVAFS